MFVLNFFLRCSSKEQQGLQVSVSYVTYINQWQLSIELPYGIIERV